MRRSTWDLANYSRSGLLPYSLAMATDTHITVGLKFLEHFVKQSSSNYSFQLSSNDMTFLRMQDVVTEELNKKIEDEITHMPEITS